MSWLRQQLTGIENGNVSLALTITLKMKSVCGGIILIPPLYVHLLLQKGDLLVSYLTLTGGHQFAASGQGQVRD